MKQRIVVGLGAFAVVAAAMVATATWAPRGLPPGIIVLGLVIGALNSLVALGLVLIYRAGRYVNFAQGGLGAAGALVTGKLVTINGVNFFLASLAGLATAAALAGLVELLFVRRLFRTPRLILTVATIGIAQLFGGFEIFIGAVWNTATGAAPQLTVPLELTIPLGAVVLRGEHVLVMIVAPLAIAALGAFFRYTDFGTAVQAAAGNADRARLLGVSIRRVSSAVWILAGLLAGLTAILQAPIVGFTFGAAAGPALLLRALAPAMIGGLTSMGWTVVAGLGLGVFEQIISWNTNASGPVEAALFGVILVSLLVQRRRRGRMTEGEESSFAGASKVRPFPRELARLPQVRLARRILGGAVLALVLAAPLGLSLTQRNLAALLVIYMIATLSLTLLSGYAGQVSFGHWAFVGFGALFGAWLRTAWDGNALVIGLVVCLAGAALALVMGLPALRIRGLFLGIVTLAFAVSSSAYLFRLPFFTSAEPMVRPRFGPINFDDELAFYYLCLGLLMAVMLVVRNIRSTRWGRNLIAVRDNDRAAASYGVDPTASKLLAFVASGFFAALAGYLYAFSQVTVTAASFPVEVSLMLFASVVIGGLGSISGAIIAALYLRGIQFFAPSLQLFSTSFGLLLILMFLPNGLGGLAFQLRDGLLRRLADRWDIVVPSLLADRRDDDADALEHEALAPTSAAAPVEASV